MNVKGVLTRPKVVLVADRRVFSIVHRGTAGEWRCGDGEPVAGLEIWGAAAAAESWLCGDCDVVAGTGHRSEYRNFSATGRGETAYPTGQKSAGTCRGARRRTPLDFGAHGGTLFLAYESDVGANSRPPGGF